MCLWDILKLRTPNSYLACEAFHFISHCHSKTPLNKGSYGCLYFAGCPILEPARALGHDPHGAPVVTEGSLRPENMAVASAMVNKSPVYYSQPMGLPIVLSHKKMHLRSVRPNCVHINNNECYKNQQPQKQSRPLKIQKPEIHLKAFKYNYAKRKKKSQLNNKVNNLISKSTRLKNDLC